MSLDLADIKPSVLNALMIFLIVAITVPLAKFLLNKYRVPGLSDLVSAI